MSELSLISLAERICSSSKSWHLNWERDLLNRNFTEKGRCKYGYATGSDGFEKPSFDLAPQLVLLSRVSRSNNCYNSGICVCFLHSCDWPSKAKVRPFYTRVSVANKANYIDITLVFALESPGTGLPRDWDTSTNGPVYRDYLDPTNFQVPDIDACFHMAWRCLLGRVSISSHIFWLLNCRGIFLNSNNVKCEFFSS